MLRLCRFLVVAAVLTITGSAGADPLTDKLSQVLSFTTAHNGINGVVVERLSDKHIVFTQNPDLRLMPASNRKLFTSATGLEMLGDSWQPETDILATAHPDAQGVLLGDLIVKGGGDSTLTVDDYTAIAKQLAAMGIKSIQGDLIADDTLFTDGPYGAEWGWDYLSDDYAPQISALEVNRGVVTVRVDPGSSPGDPVTFTLTPPIPFMEVHNSATTAAPKLADSGVAPSDVNSKIIKATPQVSGAVPGDPPDSLLVERRWDRNVIDVTGTLPAGKPAQIDITVADPTRYAITVFAAILADNGMTVSGSIKTAKCPAEAIALLKHQGPKIADYIKLMNKPSDNLLAESLIRLVGAARGKGGDYDDGHLVEDQFLKTLGLDTTRLTLADGCGVSRRDFVTAQSVANLLVAMHARPDWKTYYDSLPIAGVDGTLRKRMKGTLAAGNVHAKTGSLGEVSCLSGYITSRSGSIYVFSVLNNNYSGSTNDIRKMQDRFVEALAAGL